MDNDEFAFVGPSIPDELLLERIAEQEQRALDDWVQHSITQLRDEGTIVDAMNAILLASDRDWLIPDWARETVREGLQRLDDEPGLSLDDAFSYKKVTRARWAKRDRDLHQEVFIFMYKALYQKVDDKYTLTRRDDVNVIDAVLAAMEEFGIGKHKVEELWRNPPTKFRTRKS